MQTKWNFKSLIVGGNTYKIDGYNIWDYEWRYLPSNIKVMDPQYKQEFKLDIIEFNVKENLVRFGLVEFSNNIYGIYEEQNTNKKK
ncbi:MAG: hypothetical protein KGZ87_00490 [Bacteroidetes bacterium]|nr:hypothetical protein [Bacteroidota bacterium]